MFKLIFSGFCLIASLSLIAQNAQQWRGSNRDGKYNEAGLLKSWPADGPKLLWHFDSLGLGHSSPAIFNDKIYITGTQGEQGAVFTFDLSGKLLWKKEYGKEWFESFEGVRSSPMINEGKLYILSSYGLVTCMNADNGDILWSADLTQLYDARNIKWGFTENLLIDGNMLFCCPGGKDVNVVALDKNTGSLIWKCAGNGEKSAYCSPMIIPVNDKKILVHMTESTVLGIDSKDGKLLWTHNHPNKWSVQANTPIYNEGSVYVFSGYGKGGELLKLSDDGSQITETWHDDSLDSKMGGAILLDGKIYGSGDANKRWFCVDWKTGKVLYSSKMLKVGNVIYADGLLYCYADDGTVGLVEPKEKDFNLISSFKVPYGEKQHWAHLVIDNKKLFVRHGNSFMVYSIAAE